MHVFKNMNAELELPAVAEFFDAERGRLVGYVRRWLSDIAEEDAEDIVQEVALNIFDRGDVTAPIRNLAAYVYRALKNGIIDHIRQKKPEVSLDAPRAEAGALSLAGLLKDEADAPETQVERRELQERLARALDALKPEDRGIILATDFDGWTFAELAEEWDVPLGTLLARKSRALKKIRKFLEASEKSVKEEYDHE